MKILMTKTSYQDPLHLTEFSGFIHGGYRFLKNSGTDLPLEAIGPLGVQLLLGGGPYDPL